MTRRPAYPERVYELLVERCGLGMGSAVLEIGPGTGLATRRLIAAGARVTAVEPDPGQVDHLRRSFPAQTLEVVGASFEAAPLADNAFDLACAAMSFHWVGQSLGVPKLARVLRPGGWAAVWWTLYRDGTRPDPFHESTRAIVDPALPAAQEERPFELDVDGWRNVLVGRGGLTDFEADIVRWTARLDAYQIRTLYGSTLTIRRRPPGEQQAVLDRLVEIATVDFGGVVERPFVTALYLARKPEAPTSPPR
jgi:SAM-dependent methyltransferase